MIDLNFIPEQDQKAIARYAMGIVIHHLAIWFLFVVVVVGLFLGWGKFFLERNLAVWDEQAILVAKHKVAISDRVRLLNESALAVSKIQEKYLPMSRILIEFSKIVPAGNQVYTFEVNSENKTVKIRGFSTTRENVIAFENALKNSSFFTNIKSPLTNLLNPRNIDFEFTADLADVDEWDY